MKSGKGGISVSVIAALLVFALLWGGAVVLMDALKESSETEQLRLIENTVRRSLMTCYALEGAYPSDLGYLEKHYSLAYDRERYLVTYDWFASNVMPHVRVHVRGDGLE